MKALQTRVLSAWPSWMAKTPSKLLQSVKSKLVKAYNDDQLRVGLENIHECVRLDPRGSEDSSIRAASGRHVIVGGIKDFHRNPASARLIRNDGAWLHFTILVEWDGKDALELLDLLVWHLRPRDPEKPRA